MKRRIHGRPRKHQILRPQILTIPLMNENKKKVVIVDDHPLFRGRLAQLINYEPDMEVTGEAENTNQKYLKFSHISPFPVGSLVMRVQPS